MAPPVATNPQDQQPPITNDPPSSASGILTQTTVQDRWTPATALKQIPPASRPHPHSSSPIAFFHALERLKTTKREGWRRFDIVNGESVSDHMYRMSIMTMFAPRDLAARLDIQRCTKMALVHDMAELLVGDITPVDGVLKPEKSRRESTTMDYLCEDLVGKLDGGAQGREIREVWQEYEDGQTLESKFVHDVDKIELILQMMEYEKSQGGGVDLGEFTHVAGRIVLPEIKNWSNEILAERREYWKGLGKQPYTAEEVSAEKMADFDEYYGEPAVNGHH